MNSAIGQRATNYAPAVLTGATETLLVGLPANGVTTATVGGSATNGDTVNVTVYDAGITGGSQTFTHNVMTGDSVNAIASDLASKISALSGNGITASVPNSTTGVINISSASQNTTTYTVSVTGAQTETITLAPSVGATQTAYNNVNEPTSISAGGAVRFAGTTDRPVQPVTMNSGAVTAMMLSSQSFYANPILASGINAETVSATSGGGTNTTNTYQILASSTASASLTSDANGNLTSDGTRSFAWDAENRLVQVTYPGSGNYSTFLYDGLSRVVQIVEYTGGTATSTKNFIWCGNRMCEARDASSNLISQYFALGQVNFSGGSGSNFLYTKDHLGSIREMTNGTGTVVYQQSFDPYGRPIVLVNTTVPDFGYAGMYFHAPSGLYLTKYRAYSPILGRWLSRDPLAERMGTNLYAYVFNDPTFLNDSLGLADLSSLFQAYSAGFGPNRITALPDQTLNWNPNDVANQAAAYTGAMSAVGLGMVGGAMAGAGAPRPTTGASCPVRPRGPTGGSSGPPSNPGPSGTGSSGIGPGAGGPGGVGGGLGGTGGSGDPNIVPGGNVTVNTTGTTNVTVGPSGNVTTSGGPEPPGFTLWGGGPGDFMGPMGPRGWDVGGPNLY